MTDKEIVERAKEAEKRTGFGELVHSPISKGVNSAFGIGFVEGMVEYRNSLQEEPVSNPIDFEKELYKAFGQVKDFALGMRIAKWFYNMGRNHQEPVSEEWIKELRTKLDSLSKEDFKKVFDKYAVDFNEEPVSEQNLSNVERTVKNWKDAQGDDLPEIDREVIALLDNGKVVFAHRPPEFWDGKDIVTGKVTRNYPKTYDKGGWNIPNVKYWLDCLMPKEIGL